jgi:predicted nucleotidyltransferase
MIIDQKIIKQKLNADLALIISEILECYQNNVTSIILYGSYGRGEGGFFINDEKKISAYNDYDLVVISDEFVSSDKLKSLEENLVAITDVQWIDICQKNKENLQNLSLTIFNYDLKFGSKVIYGDSEILNYIPDFDSQEIPLNEAETLYFTRLWPFLGSMTENAFVIGLKNDESRFFRNQMCKAFLAVVDVVLLQSKLYHTSYLERVDRFKKVTSTQDVCMIADWAIQEKLRPSNQTMSGEEVKELYGSVLSVYLKEMYQVLSKFYNTEIKSASDLRKGLLYSKYEWLLFLKTTIKTKSLIYIKRRNLKIAQGLVAEAFFNQEFENEAKYYLKKLDKTLNLDNMKLHDLRILVAKLRMKI